MEATTGIEPVYTVLQVQMKRWPIKALAVKRAIPSHRRIKGLPAFSKTACRSSPP
jgi:hypothetical protein